MAGNHYINMSIIDTKRQLTEVSEGNQTWRFGVKGANEYENFLQSSPNVATQQFSQSKILDFDRSEPGIREASLNDHAGKSEQNQALTERNLNSASNVVNAQNNQQDGVKTVNRQDLKIMR